jgi:hypothetical protein
MFAGAYHFSRPDVAGNTGVDEADHFIEMAGAWMRPGFLPPVLDLEAGSGSDHLAQFSIDFSNRVYDVTGIRPAIYVNGNYSNILQNASGSLPDQLAQPIGEGPSVVGPAFSVLWNARWPSSPDVQNEHPRDTSNLFYGPWDDYGETHPWDFWQYSSSGTVTGISPVDTNVSQGDIEALKDTLVPAVWMSDSSGDWSTLLNWNSGQDAPADPQDPAPAPDQLPRVGPWTPPAPRLPGAPGSGPTAGQHDTVIIERPSADVTVTVSAGDHNVRKLYMRETLEITGGSLTINYDPNYATPTDGLGNPLYPNAKRSGPVSAQFSGDATLGGDGSLSVHALQVDAGRTFTFEGGASSLAFGRIDLMPHASAPATMVFNDDFDVSPLTAAGSTIASGAGAGMPGRVDFGGVTRTAQVADGAAGVDLAIMAPIVGGGLIKTGAGTMHVGDVVDGGVAVSAGALGGHGAVAGDVSFAATTAFDYRYGATAATASVLDVQGNLNIASDVAFQLTSFEGPLPKNAKLTLLSYGGAWNNATFDGYANNSTFNLGANQFQIKYDDTPVGSANGGAYGQAITLTALTGPQITTINGFVEYYSPANWTVTDANGHGGFIDASGAPGSVRIVGPDDGSGEYGEIDFTIAVQADGTVSFDWSYFSSGTPGYDRAFYVNGIAFSLLGASDGDSGSVSIPVNAGDLIGWRVASSDSILGAGELTISNFSAPALAIPEPRTGALLAIAVVAWLAFDSRRRGGDQ